MANPSVISLAMKPPEHANNGAVAQGLGLWIFATVLGCSSGSNSANVPTGGIGACGATGAVMTTSSMQPNGGTQGTGGNGATGGASVTAGQQSSGGNNREIGGAEATATGGSRVNGGVQSVGGTLATGESRGFGGATSAASTAVGLGGGKATGGTQAVGGTQSGGIETTGGFSSTGGTKAIAGSTAAGGTSANGGKSNTSAVRSKFSVYLAGDSTVSTYTLTSSTKDQAGWGQMLQQYYDSNYVTVVNKAVGGMTARHFMQAGNLDEILRLLHPGDYFLIQFGTNDSNSTATYTIDGVSYPYFADANTDFKTYLQEYIDATNVKGATAVLVTPPPRNSAYCNGGRSMGSYADAMLALGKADNVAAVNLSIKTWTYLSEICPAPTSGSTETVFKVNADNSIDGTHFQENGATLLAGFVADGVGEAGLGLDAYRVR